MFLAPNMILVGIFAEIRSLADGAVLLEGCFIGGSVRTGLCRENFFVEDLGRDWWKGSHTTF